MSDRSQKQEERLGALLGQFARQDPRLQLVFLDAWATLQDGAGALLLSWNGVVRGSEPASPELLERMFAAEAATASRPTARLAALRALSGLVAARLKAKKEDPHPEVTTGPPTAEGGARGVLGGPLRPSGPFDFGATGS